MWLLLLAMAVAPGLAICIYIFWKDKFDAEPRHLLVKSFFLGVFSCVPAIILSILAEKMGSEPNNTSLLFSAFSCIAGIGFTEEFSKFIFVRFYTYKKAEFNEPFDGITYCVMVAMGFATLENILYVFNGDDFSGSFNIAIARMIFSVPGHAMFGVIMGYFLGIEKHYNKPNMGFLGLIIAAVVHGLFDFSLFNSSSYPIFLLVFLGLFIGIVRLSLKAIKLHQANSPFQNNDNPS